MKNSISFAFSMLFITFCCIIFINMMLYQFQVTKLGEFHYAMVQEIESSDFSSSVMQKYQKNEDYEVEIENRSIKDDLGIYQIKTKKLIRMPILGFKQTILKESVAR